MKKYIDAELLLKEVESRMGDCDANSKNPNQLLWAELAALIPFIDSLQQEQPSEDLEKAAEDGARQNYVAGGYSPFPNIEYGAYKNGFIAGAEWQKEQMLEDAVEGEVCKGDGDVWIELSPNAMPHFKDMQPVKVIVIKED